jgi:hypothetical protein
MPSDEFRTELRNPLTAFYEKLLKKVAAGNGTRPIKAQVTLKAISYWIFYLENY